MIVELTSIQGPEFLDQLTVRISEVTRPAGGLSPAARAARHEYRADVPALLSLKLVQRVADQGVASAVSDQLASVGTGAVAVQHIDEIFDGRLDFAYAIPVGGYDQHLSSIPRGRTAQILRNIVSLFSVRVRARPVPEVIHPAGTFRCVRLRIGAGCVAVDEDYRVWPGCHVTYPETLILPDYELRPVRQEGQALVPPSTVRFAPVMYEDSGPATNDTNAATSSTCPYRSSAVTAF